MITQEMYDNGTRCRGAGLNCRNCTTTNGCVQYVKPNKMIKVKGKYVIIEEEPIGSSIIVTNEKFSFFRAFRGQRLDRDSKKYVAYIHEIVEELE